jgi:arginyl-tRNA synthetase
MDRLRNTFSQALADTFPGHRIVLDRPRSWDIGDIAFPCFAVAKTLGQDPHLIAKDLANRLCIAGADLVAVGPYLNLRLQPLVRARFVLKAALGTNPYGSAAANGKTILIEYSSPNIAKLFTIGHLRSTMIGHSLSQVNRYLGFDVVRLNHIGDWGTQFGTMLAAYKKWAERENPELTQEFSWADQVPERLRSPLYRLFQLYVRFHADEVNDPALHDEAKRWFVRLETGDAEALGLWSWFREISIKEFLRIYERLGVSFDHMDMGEAFYQGQIASTLNLLQSNALLTEGYDGAHIVDLEDVGISTPCLVKKSDGSSIYATRDIAAAIFRRKKWDFYQCLYVVGSDQILHFKQLFAVMEKVDSWYRNRMVHVPFGMISLSDGKMSTRKGNVIFLEDVLDEAVSRVKTIIETKNPELPDKMAVAEMLGVGAVVFFNALNDRVKPITFDWDRVIALDGDTGPYVQYAHARIISLLFKAGGDWVAKARPFVTADADSAIIQYPNIDIPESMIGLEDDAAQALLFELAFVPEAYRIMQRDNMGTVLARHLLCIAKAFSGFYTNCPILSEYNSEDVRCSRLNLCIATARVLRQGLFILGIQAPETM